jgi:hypothetical protein
MTSSFARHSGKIGNSPGKPRERYAGKARRARIVEEERDCFQARNLGPFAERAQKTATATLWERKSVAQLENRSYSYIIRELSINGADLGNQALDF